MCSGRYWYVSNVAAHNGADAGGTAGQQRTRPLLTTLQAVTNSAVGDTIVYLEGHNESIASAITTVTARHFISEGTAATRAQLQSSAAGQAVFAAVMTRAMFENISFKAGVASNATTALSISAATEQVDVVDCTFEIGAGATQAVLLGAGMFDANFKDCTFTNVATTPATRPASAITAAGAIAGLLSLDTVTFDGGTVGWTAPALNLNGGAVSGLLGIDVDLLRDSDIFVATGSVYRFYKRNSTGSAVMEFTA